MAQYTFYTFEETSLTYGSYKLIRVKSLDPKWKDSPAFVFPESFISNSEINKRFEIFPDDIWLMCYPKTGSTWTQEMIWLLNNDLDFEAAKSTLEKARFLFYE
jgi:hypothetical protein